MAGYIRELGNNKYRMEYMLNGIRYSKNIIAKTPSQAKKCLAEFVTSIEQETFVKSTKYTFTQFAQVWLDEYARQNCTVKTVEIYKIILNHRILPSIRLY